MSTRWPARPATFRRSRAAAFRPSSIGTGARWARKGRRRRIRKRITSRVMASTGILTGRSRAVSPTGKPGPRKAASFCPITLGSTAICATRRWTCQVRSVEAAYPDQLVLWLVQRSELAHLAVQADAHGPALRQGNNTLRLHASLGRGQGRALGEFRLRQRHPGGHGAERASPIAGSTASSRHTLIGPRPTWWRRRSRRWPARECHAKNGRLAALAGFYMPGRDNFQWLDWAGYLLLAATFAGVLLHALLRGLALSYRKERNHD